MLVPRLRITVRAHVPQAEWARTRLSPGSAARRGAAACVRSQIALAPGVSLSDGALGPLSSSLSLLGPVTAVPSLQWEYRLIASGCKLAHHVMLG